MPATLPRTTPICQESSVDPLDPLDDPLDEKFRGDESGVRDVFHERTAGAFDRAGGPITEGRVGGDRSRRGEVTRASFDSET